MGTETTLEPQYYTKQHIAAFFDDAPYGMAIVSPAGEFIKVNKELCNILGYTEAELLNIKFQDITASEDLTADLAALHSVLTRQTDQYQMFKEYKTKFGSRVKVKLTVRAITIDGDTVIHLVSSIQQLYLLCDTDVFIEEREKKGRAKIRPKFPLNKIIKDNWKWFITIFVSVLLFAFNSYEKWITVKTQQIAHDKKIEMLEKIVVQQLLDRKENLLDNDNK